METLDVNSEARLARARECLALISGIAGRGARSQKPNVVWHALQSLTAELLVAIGVQEESLEVIFGGDSAPPAELFGLETLLEELRWVNDASRDLSVPGWECDGFDHPN